MQAAAELLESIAGNRELLAGVSEAERTRLLSAAGRISRPDAVAAPAVGEGDETSAQGRQIAARGKGAQPDRHPQIAPADGFHTPNVFSAPDFKQIEIENNRTFAKPVEEQNCYICKQDYPTIHPFLRPALPEVRGAEFFQAHRDGGFARSRGVAHRRSREDWVSGGHQMLRAGAQLIVTTRFPARFGDALRCRAGFCGVEKTGLKFLVWICAIRPVSKRFANICSPRATGWISSSTTRARPCVVRRIFMRI